VCADIACANATVSSTATGCGITASFTFTQDSIGNVDFTAQPVGAAFGADPQYVYNWDFGNGQTASSQTGIFGGGNTATSVYSTTANYTVCLYVTDSALSCTDTICTLIAVVVNPIVCNVNADHTFTQDSLGNVTLTASPGGNGNSYFWDFGDGTNQDGNGGGFFTPAEDAPHNYAQTNGAGTYFVCLILTENNSQCSDTVCKNITVIIDSATVCAISTSFTYVTDSLGNVDFDASPTTAAFSGDSYIWDYGDGTIDTVGGFFATNTTTHVYAATGNYNACLTFNKGNGCVASFCDVVSVFVDTTTVGISKQKNAQNVNAVKVYPNPSKDLFNIGYSLNENSLVEIALYNLTGDLIAKQVNENQLPGEHQFQLNGNDLGEGIYLLHIAINGVTERKLLTRF
jgi:hypothetical protein